METGPLVVLEAFAAGVPVIGSRLGGIAELVDHGIDGLLVETESVPAWTDVLAQLLQDADLLPRLRAGIRPPRRMSTVADEMLALYHELRPAA
jgi:glycosyltransferase involved in cell wall biosynthesis